MEIGIKQQDAILNIVQRAAQHLQLVGVSHDIGDQCVGEQPAAVRKNRALRPDHLAVRSAQVEWRGVAGSNETYSLGDECIEISRFEAWNFEVKVKQRLGNRYAAWVIPAEGQGDDLGAAAVRSPELR